MIKKNLPQARGLRPIDIFEQKTIEADKMLQKESERRSSAKKINLESLA